MKPTIASIPLVTLVLIANSAANALTITQSYQQQQQQQKQQEPIKISIKTSSSEYLAADQLDTIDLFVTFVADLSTADLPGSAAVVHENEVPSKFQRSSGALENRNDYDGEGLFEEDGSDEAEWQFFDSRRAQLTPSTSQNKAEVNEEDNDDEDDEFLDVEDDDLDEQIVESETVTETQSDVWWQKLKQWLDSKLTDTDQSLILASIGYLTAFAFMAFMAIQYFGGKKFAQKKRAGYHILPTHSDGDEDNFDFDHERNRIKKQALYRLPDPFTHSAKDVNKFFNKH